MRDTHAALVGNLLCQEHATCTGRQGQAATNKGPTRNQFAVRQVLPPQSRHSVSGHPSPVQRQIFFHYAL